MHPIRFTHVPSPPPPIKILGIVRPREMWKLVSYSVEMVSYSSYLRKTLVQPVLTGLNL